MKAEKINLVDMNMRKNQVTMTFDEFKKFKRLAEIGAMVEVQDADPKRQVIFKTKLGESGEVLEPLKSALEKFRSEQESDQNVISSYRSMPSLLN